MRALRVVVEGEPSTDHRPRYVGIDRRGKPRFKPSDPYKRWKARCHLAAVIARACWEEEHGEVWPLHAVGPRGGKLPMLYAVSGIGFLAAMRKDADNCVRGFRDAAEGVLWPNDNRCRPVADDAWKATDALTPCLVVEVVPWDPRDGLMLARFEWRPEGD